MGWNLLEKPVAPPKPIGAKLTLRVGKRGTTLLIALPSSHCVGTGWRSCDNADVFFGTDEDAGKVKIIPVKGGLLHIARIKTSMLLFVPGQPGWPTEKRRWPYAPVEWETDGVVVTLPPDFDPNHNTTRTLPADARNGNGSGVLIPAKKLGIQIVGNVAQRNGKAVKFNALYLKVFTWMCEREFCTAGDVMRMNPGLKEAEVLAFWRNFRAHLEPLQLVVINLKDQGCKLQEAGH